jgi:hypothetical protein
MSTEGVNSGSLPAKQSHGPRLWPSLTGFAIAYIIVPLFYYPLGSRSDRSIEGTGISVLAASVCCYGFFSCPRRPLRGKIVAAVALGLTIVYATWCVVAYILYGRPD